MPYNKIDSEWSIRKMYNKTVKLLGKEQEKIDVTLNQALFLDETPIT